MRVGFGKRLDAGPLLLAHVEWTGRLVLGWLLELLAGNRGGSQMSLVETLLVFEGELFAIGGNQLVVGLELGLSLFELFELSVKPAQLGLVEEKLAAELVVVALQDGRQVVLVRITFGKLGQSLREVEHE